MKLNFIRKIGIKCLKISFNWIGDIVTSVQKIIPKRIPLGVF
jgi:hypothetical protein